MTTNAGDISLNIEQNLNKDTVSGNVILNKVVSCTTQHKTTITVMIRQKYLVQSLCDTSSGQAYTILEP